MYIDEKFLTLLKMHNCVWDPDHPENRNPFMRYKTWKRIGQQMQGWQVTKCKKKYRELRDELRRIYTQKCEEKDLPLKRRLDFLKKSFRNLPPEVPQLGSHRSGSVRGRPPGSSNRVVNLRNRSVSLLEPAVDPLFLDPDEMYDDSEVKTEDFPSDLATLRIVEPRETTTRNEDFEIRSVRSMFPNAVNGFSSNSREVEEQRLPQVPSVRLPSPKPSGFTLALDEKLRLLPPRVRIKLERDIFLMVSDEVAKLFD
ncbi:uncharacterized protein LOC132265446 isoform X2 [Phlebotomus argentipes]|uniref:uncharacterized protein LOC132265446 isoform X2 n=1 Tax=Phlebotomus argentipes TaxID=94469 RepID=UPI002892CE07|nr:uncharacterized protein LOC132265446 isoform X2 [Phlebotomus argentipes]